MVITKTDIANLALTHIGGAKVHNFRDDKTIEADLVRTYYDISRQAELETYDWSFARRFISLAVASEDPISPWLFAYVIPEDCLAVRMLHKEVKTVDDTRIPYEIISDSINEQNILLTNKPEAILRYTFNQGNTTQFTTNFSIAISHRLAAYIAYSRTNKRDIRDAQLALAEISRLLAQGSDANASRVDFPENAAIWTLDRNR